MTWLVTGASGQLGMAFQRALPTDGTVCFADRTICNLAESQSLADCLTTKQPSVIINCAAYTAVDAAEDDRMTAFRVNATAVGEMAKWAADHGVLMVHFSTDYVFDGTDTGSYTEEALVNPQSVYGHSKAAGEVLFTESGASGFCLRTSWVHSNDGRNFFLTMKKLMQERDQLRVVEDQRGVPTTTDFLVDVTRHLIAHRLQGDGKMPNILHAVPDGNTSWFGFASHIREMMARRNGGTDLAEIEPIASSEFPQAARRPPNSAMSNALLAATLGRAAGDWTNWHSKLYDW
jgi:dTDP-4-dehydrorhamnose reductase